MLVKSLVHGLSGAAEIALADAYRPGGLVLGRRGVHCSELSDLVGTK